MIPYDDLVAALSSWRARQGLPVNTLGGGGSGPTAKAGSGPNRAPVPPPVAAYSEEPLEAAEEMLDDAAYEPAVAEDALELQPEHNEVEATAIGSAPERPTEMDMGNGREDW